MKILIANERLLFRFGLDRVLLVLARMLRASGHSVTLMANRLDLAVASRVADRVLEMPVGGEGYLSLNEFTAAALDARWREFFPPGTEPDLALVGGWPFFAAIPVFRSKGVRTAFLDCGAVPLDGMEEGARITQEKLREMRRRNLPYADAILAISHFIELSQSRIDAPRNEDIRTLLLGADHLAGSEWTGELLRSQAPSSESLAIARGAQASGAVVFLNLGRWEPGGYKSSQTLFDVARTLVRSHRRVAFLVLDTPERVAVPEDLREIVLPVGFPDDQELIQVIGVASAGITLSRWEGFNLPIAELQWQGKPAFALDLAAHPEVVCDSWFLARDEKDLARRIELFLDAGAPDTWPASVDAFRREFTWHTAGMRYVEALESIAAARRRTVLVDATNACRDPANSGVMRVVRRGTHALQKHANVLFALWSPELQTYVWPSEPEYAVLSAFNGPMISPWHPRSPVGAPVPVDDLLSNLRGASAWLLLGETVMERHGHALRDWSRAAGLRIAAIFYDAIPVIRADLVADTEIRENHAAYMKGLSHCDAVVPISGFSASCLKRFWAENGCRWTFVRACLLPDELGGIEKRALPRCRESGKRVDILCVSTLEPRKGHLNLIAALTLLEREHPGVDWSLTLVGNRYAGGNSIALAVQAACAANPRIRWLRIVDDVRLVELYGSATFTVYSSTIEGFGIPIVESLWQGIPCVCHNEGVMAELATEGGCLTTDMRDPVAIASTIHRISNDVSLYDRLATQAVARKGRTWDEYAKEIMSTIEQAEQHAPRSDDWAARLYPDCLTAEWQMTDSERLALTGLLHRHKPRMAIEIGTFRGGSLSLISQYAKSVISIDIDPEIPERYSHFKNVRFLTGFSQEVLPPLLDELDKADIAVDFVLIDGDHSAAGIKRDIEILIGRTPKAPMFVMMHDGFNPECRRGMLEADWQSSPHVQWVDTDFIPGRVIEHGGGSGEMWGGLAAAYLTPDKRSGPLTVRTSAGGMWKELRDLHYDSAKG
jgi:glycosyltransferase involved in cell wall biosynthesis